MIGRLDPLKWLEKWADGFLFALSTLFDLVTEAAGDLGWRLVRGFFEIYRKSLGGAQRAFLYFIGNEKSARLRVWFGKTVIFVFAFVIFVFGQLVVLLGGAFANILGLRRGREYSAFENVMTWSPVVLGLLLFPWLVKTDYMVGQAIFFFSSTLIVIGLAILVGFSGQVSVGHSSFVLLGGYVAVNLFSGRFFGIAIPLIPSLIVGGLGAALLGIVIAYPAARIKDDYLAIFTIGLMLSIVPVLRSSYFTWLSNGFDGITFATPAPPALLKAIPASIWEYYQVLLVFGLLLHTAHVLLRRTRVGRAFIVIKEGQEKANVLGVPEHKNKVFAFGLSSFYAGVGGGIICIHSGYISTDSFSLRDSVDYLTALFIGGSGKLLGSAIGGMFLTYRVSIGAFLAAHVKNGDQLLWGLDGLILILSVILAPRGITGELGAWLFDRKFRLPLRRSHRMYPPLDYSLEEETLTLNPIPKPTPSAAQDTAQPITL